MAEDFRIGAAFVEMYLRDPTEADEARVRKGIETRLTKTPPRVAIKLASTTAESVGEWRKDATIKLAADRPKVGVDLAGVTGVAATKVRKEIEDKVGVPEPKVTIKTDVDRKSTRSTRDKLIRFAIETAAVVGPAGVIGGALLGTVGLFGGLGIAAVHADTNVTTAFGHLKSTVVADTKALAAPIIPALTDVATQTEATFRGMEDNIGSAFRVVAPQISELTGGVLDLAREALPGFTGALKASGPVVSQISADLGGLGHAVGGFLTGLSSGAPGAAQGIHAILTDIDAILPPLGRFIGSAANLTGIILDDLTPAFEAAGVILDGVSGIVDHTGGVLGPLAATAIGVYTAFRLWRGITGIVNKVGTSVTGLATRVGASEATTTRFGQAVRGVSTGLGILGIATAGVAIAIGHYRQDVERQIDTIKAWVDATRTQGQAGAGLRDQLSALADRYDKAGGVAKVFAERIRAGIKASDDTRAALGPLGRDADDVASAQDRVALAFDRFGEKSPEYRAASDELSSALERQRDDQRAVDRATRDATLSLKDQLLAIQGAIDKELGYEQSVTGTAEAQSALRQAQQELTDAVGKYGPKSDEARRAQLNLREAQDRVKQSYYDQASAAAALAVQQGDTDGGAKAYRDTLIALAKKLGPDDPLRKNLLDTIAKLDEAAVPRTTQLRADISNAQAGIAEAKRDLKTVPASKRSDIKANITDLQHKAAIARHELALIRSKTVGVSVNIVVHGPRSITVGSVGKNTISISASAAGSIVRATPGGQITQVAEGGDDEAIIPLNTRGAAFLRRSLGPLLSRQSPSTPAGPVAGQGAVYNTFHVSLSINADSLRKVQDVLDLFDRLPQAARAGGGF